MGIIFGVSALTVIAFTNKNPGTPSKENVLGETSATSETQQTTETTPSKPESTTTMQKPQMILEKGKDYKAVLHTSKGDIKVDLYEDNTPITVNNFVYLAQAGFYNKTKFHRVIKGFMIQGGDPVGNGTGGPGYKFDDEKFVGEYGRGTVAMANSGPNTNGSQFFIMHQNYPLPRDYVIFGKVTDESSLKVVDAIAEAPVTTNSFGQNTQPKEDIVVNSVDISNR